MQSLKLMRSTLGHERGAELFLFLLGIYVQSGNEQGFDAASFPSDSTLRLIQTLNCTAYWMEKLDYAAGV